jgi:hypothetical protein
MGDFILMEGDKAIFDQAFGVAVVVVQPGTLVASGPATITGKKICVVGDEAQVAVPGCTYTTPTFSAAGTGTLKIAALAGDQMAMKTNSGNKAVMLKGSKFTAKFEVIAPATNPAGVADAVMMYPGTGSFTTTNTIFQGT